MKTVLVMILVFGGQLPAQTYTAEFNTRSDCNHALAAFMRAYAETYTIWPDRRSLAAPRSTKFIQVYQADCVGDDDLLHSN